MSDSPETCRYAFRTPLACTAVSFSCVRHSRDAGWYRHAFSTDTNQFEKETEHGWIFFYHYFIYEGVIHFYALPGVLHTSSTGKSRVVITLI